MSFDKQNIVSVMLCYGNQKVSSSQAETYSYFRLPRKSSASFRAYVMNLTVIKLKIVPELQKLSQIYLCYIDIQNDIRTFCTFIAKIFIVLRNTEAWRAVCNVLGRSEISGNDDLILMPFSALF